MLYRYLVSRLVQAVVVVFGAISIGFFLTNVIGKPGDVIGGALHMTTEQRAALNARLGYDKPLLPRFLDYLGGALTGDFGDSFRTNTSAMGQVLVVLPNTLLLAASASLVAVAVALPLAVFSARKREGVWERLLRRMMGVLQGVPGFWLALMLIFLFSVQLRILPSFGFMGASSLVLPTVAVAATVVPTLFRLFRGQLLDVLGTEFIDALRARGLSERRIVYRHGMRNMAGPAITFLALLIGDLIGGAVIVEIIFSWPGIGNLMMSAVQARDYTVVQAIIIVVAISYMLLNLLADVVVVFGDPRVRR